ncbi:MAG: ATP-binding cassette domain-containing protein [Bacteroidota bacterium]
MISLQHVSKRFGDKVVLNDISFDLPKGSHLCLIGRSGVGKSVLSKLMLGLLPLEEGEIFFDGHRINALDQKSWQLLLAKVGVVFQGSALFDSLTVLENVGMLMFESHTWTEAEIQTKVRRALEMVQLSPDVMHEYPASLSGGMQKRVGIARALIHEPTYLLFDEPTTGLDPINAGAIDELVLSLREDRALTTVMVTHDMASVKKLATHVAMLHEAKLGFFGEIDAFLGASHPEVTAFLQR